MTIYRSGIAERTFPNYAALVGIDQDIGGVDRYFDTGGVADNLQIQAAIDRVLARGGGETQIADLPTGITHYDIQATIDLKDKCGIKGFSWNNTFKAKTNLNDHVIEGLGAGGAHYEDCFVEGLSIDGNKANQAGAAPLNGVELYWLDHGYVKKCKIINCKGNSVDITDGHDLVVDHVYSSYNAWNGPSMGTLVYQGRMKNSFTEHSSDVGFAVGGVGCILEGLTVKDMDQMDGSGNSQWGIGFEGGDDHVLVGFYISNVNKAIRASAGTDYVKVSCGEIEQWDRSAASSAGLETLGGHTTFSDVTLKNPGSVSAPGAFFATGADKGILQGSDIISGVNTYGVKVDAPDGVTIRSNKIEAAYGIRIWAGSVETIIEDTNRIIATIRAMWDQGTGTLLPTIKGNFSQFAGGSGGQRSPVINTAPGGIDIDANDEFVFVHIPLPDKFQEAVRIKIWAYSRVVEADRMRLRIVAHGATDNEPWIGNAIDVPDHPSETVNFAIDDVIHWMIDDTDDAQLLTLAGGDLLELLACGEVAGGADCETDVSMAGYVIEHV